MSNVLRIRQRLGLTQAAFGAAIGVSQGNVSHYEKGQVIPPGVARRIVAAAARLGFRVTFDDIYAHAAEGGASTGPMPCDEPHLVSPAEHAYPEPVHDDRRDDERRNGDRRVRGEQRTADRRRTDRRDCV